MSENWKKRCANVLALLVSLALSLVALEGSVRGFDLLARPRAVFGESTPEAEGSPRDLGRTQIHPFLGWAIRPREGQGPFYEARRYFPDGKPPGWTSEALSVNEFGFLTDIGDYREVDADRFVVGVFGGSVATQMVRFAGDTLKAELEARMPDLDRSIALLNFGAGAYKQPQQVIALVEMVTLGIRFDVIINVDGLNEAAFGGFDAEKGLHPVFPSMGHYKSRAGLATGTSSEEQIVKTAAVLLEKRAARRLLDRVSGSAVLRRSEFAKASLGLLVERHRRRATEIEAELQELLTTKEDMSAIASLSDPCLGKEDACWDLIADMWANASWLMGAISTELGGRYFHFLQPNQFVPESKPMSDEEQEVAGLHDMGRTTFARMVRNGYPHLQAGGKELRGRGVEFHDLTMLFAQHPEPLYVDDCCHYNVHGYRLLAKAVAEAVAAKVRQSDARQPPA